MAMVHGGDLIGNPNFLIFIVVILITFLALGIVIPLYFLWDPTKPKKVDRSPNADAPESEERTEI